MSDEPFALSTIPPQPLAAEGDFDTICETVKASARGRWFLEEYARRNRNADTAEVLSAIGRIETVVRDGRDREAYHHVRADLLDMARTIAVTRAEVAESKGGGGAGGQTPEHLRERAACRDLRGLCHGRAHPGRGLDDARARA
jgi:hypothetical protein